MTFGKFSLERPERPLASAMGGKAEIYINPQGGDDRVRYCNHTVDG